VKRQIWCLYELNVGDSHEWLSIEDGIGEMMTTNVTANGHEHQIASLLGFQMTMDRLLRP
jgi:hypothetical protein